jgi:hypothetical protein
MEEIRLIDIGGLISNFTKKISNEWNQKITGYLKENLKALGYEFDSDLSFYEFCGKRITIIYSADKINNCFYLDYIDGENKGTLIGSFSDKVEIIHEGNKITAIIG